MFAIDTNILVYAHNVGATFHEAAYDFLQRVMTPASTESFSVCVPSQVLIEFLNVITWSRLEAPLSLPTATEIVRSYVNSGIPIIHPKPTQLDTLFGLLGTIESRKKIFDVSLAATLKDNGVRGLFTVNSRDFETFEFLQVENPLV